MKLACKALFKYLDARLVWGVRHFIYKAFAGHLAGVGYLGKPSFIKGFHHFYAGQDLGIFPGWRIEILNGSVRLGHRVRIGNNFFLNCGSEVSIDDDCTISANVFIGTTDVVIANDINKPFNQWDVVERPVSIGRGCFIGFGAALLPGTTLADGCVVGANSVVRGNFGPGSVISGIPGRLLWVRI